ncbi:ABC transporter permease [Streptosporangium longisporum]|uniref:ABC transporter permease n=1 Tax=Streptosporangium longisporum TaxID=46187 RepID=A0ABP6KYH4_9ACTN
MKTTDEAPRLAGGSPGVPAPSPGARWRALVAPLGQQLAPFTIVFVICVVLWILTPHFLTTSNILGNLVQMSSLAIIAVGATMVIVAAGIDLSVSTVVGLAGVVSTVSIVEYGTGVPLGLLAGVAAGGLVGLVNGLLVSKLGLPAFITTLGTLSVCGGAALLITDGKAVYGLPDGFKWLGNGTVLGIPVPIVLMLVVAFAGHFLLSRTTLGRAAYAIGGNPETARLSGINVAAILIALYVISGLLAGLAGILEASRVVSGQPTAGTNYNLNAIAAAVIGGASLFGGEGRIVGAVVGAMILQLIGNGSNLLNISTFWQSVIVGVVVILAVLYDQIRHRRARKAT